MTTYSNFLYYIITNQFSWMNIFTLQDPHCCWLIVSFWLYCQEPLTTAKKITGHNDVFFPLKKIKWKNFSPLIAHSARIARAKVSGAHHLWARSSTWVSASLYLGMSSPRAVSKTHILVSFINYWILSARLAAWRQALNSELKKMRSLPPLQRG